MNELLAVSYVLLWVLVLLLLGTVLALARQIGLIYRRLPPVYARDMAEGPAIGSSMPILPATALAGGELQIGGPAKARRLYVFVGAGCSVCDELAPALASFARHDRDEAELILVGVAGDANSSAAFVDRHGLGRIPYALAPDASATYGVTGTPFAILIDPAGTVEAKGLPNHLEHLESLLITPNANHQHDVTSLDGRVAGRGQPAQDHSS